MKNSGSGASTQKAIWRLVEAHQSEEAYVASQGTTSLQMQVSEHADNISNLHHEYVYKLKGIIAIEVPA